MLQQAAFAAAPSIFRAQRSDTTGARNHGNAADDHHLHLYRRLRDQGAPLSVNLVIAALKWCALSRDLKSGKEIHEDARRNGTVCNAFVASTLLAMYGKCGSMEDAEQVFEGLPDKEKSEASWTNMILGYAQKGQGKTALQLFQRMQDEGCVPSYVTLVAAAKACSSLAHRQNREAKLWCLENGRCIHRQVANSNREMHPVLANTLIDMYAKCGSMPEAVQIFEEMCQRSVVSWAVLIMGYAQNGERGKALTMFLLMQNEGLSPSAVAFVAALKACAGAPCDNQEEKRVFLEQGRRVHSQAVASGHAGNVFIASAAVDMYAKCGSMENASATFERMVRKDVVCWTALLMGYEQAGEDHRVLELYARMQAEGCEKNSVTFIAVLKACGSLAESDGRWGAPFRDAYLSIGRRVEAEVIRSGYGEDSFVSCALVDMYSKCGSLQKAREVFDGMRRKDTAAWNCVIMGHAEGGEADEAMQLFSSMKEAGARQDSGTFVAALKACSRMAEQGRRAAAVRAGRLVHNDIVESGCYSDVFVGNMLMEMYAKCGNVEKSREVFEQMATKHTVSWSHIMEGYAANGEAATALELYERMAAEGFERDSTSYVAALRACSSLAMLERGLQIHEELKKTRSELVKDAALATTLLDFYGKCGAMAEAEAVFASIPASKRDLAAWGALAMGYSRQGEVDRVFELIKQQQQQQQNNNPQVQNKQQNNSRLQENKSQHQQNNKQRQQQSPGAVVMLAAIAACSHAGQADRGKELLQRMEREHGVSPSVEHYNCVIDALGRCKRLAEAVEMAERVPCSVVAWMSVLSSARKWGDVSAAEAAFQRLLLLLHKEQQHEDAQAGAGAAAAAFVLMAEVYEAAGMVQRAEEVRSRQRAATVGAQLVAPSLLR